MFIQTELEELATAEARSKVEKFLATENSIVTKPVDAFSRTTEGTKCVCLYLVALICVLNLGDTASLPLAVHVQ